MRHATRGVDMAFMNCRLHSKVLKKEVESNV